MPKVELHKHLEGSIRFSTLKELFVAQNPTSNTYTSMVVGGEGVGLDEAARNHFCVCEEITSLTDFLDKFEHTQQVLASTDIIERVTFEACEDAALRNVIVLELRYSPVYILRGHDDLTVESIHAAVVEGVKRAERQYSQMAVGLIGIMDRCSTLEEATDAANFFIENKDTFVGVDLANDEERFDGLHLVPLFERCKEKGLHVTIHAGEVPTEASPSHVGIAIEQFGATRIGHGIHVCNDASVVAKAKDAGIVFEVCPSSNVLIGNVKSFEEHPLRRMLDEGLRVTLSTDDPGLFYLLDIEKECTTAITKCGITLGELWRCQVQGYDSSFLPKSKTEDKWQTAVQKWKETQQVSSTQERNRYN